MADKGAVNPVNRAAFHQKAKANWKTGSTFGQLDNAKTLVALIRELDPEFGPESKDGRYSEEDWKKISQYLYIGSNANAVNNVLHGRGQKAASILDELSID